MVDGNGKARDIDIVAAIDNLAEVSAWCVMLSETLFGIGLIEDGETGTALRMLAQIPERLARDINGVAKELCEGRRQPSSKARPA